MENHTHLLQSLISDFEARIDELSRVVKFRHEVSDDHVQDQLKNTSNSVRMLEKKIADARQLFHDEKASFDEIEPLVAISERQKVHLAHIQSNLPARLPGPSTPSPKKKRTAKDKDAKEKAPPSAKRRKQAAAFTSKVPQMPYVTKSELDGVPSYMRGRITLELINSGVDCIRSTLQSKYDLMSIPWSRLSEVQMKKYTTYKDQETDDTDGVFFFIDTDFRENATGTQLDAATALKSVTQVLRHLGRLKQMSSTGIVRYCLVK